jgi:hypothetical protein
MKTRTNSPALASFGGEGTDLASVERLQRRTFFVATCGYPLQRWSGPSRPRFQKTLMRQAVRRPRHRIEPFRVDRSSIDRALTECAIVNPLQGILNLLKHCGVEFTLDEVLTRRFVRDALVGRITTGVPHVFAAMCEFTLQPRANLVFELHKPLSIVLCVNHSSLRLMRPAGLTCVAPLLKHLMHKSDRNRALADRRRHALDVAGPHIAGGKDAGSTRLQ